ncbi:DUF4350 domain-containing protein [Pedobacter sp. CFBP9032]|uniref:DUF4350 domain-containing protein n=1 Tax=Pedobacter sp. CFBP9032 TaxID=3096539 RepID=UPI002A6A99CC|nr:DUF4350 domain-containing protein [Pedobacter sp. CFBP9032]MDY0903860.1 DUF4350 domain-containing protein [Pedobacter sp. CFBP9032]
MRGFKIYFALGLIIILAYLVAQYNKPTPTNWAPTYLSTDKIPYGTFIFSNRIKDIAPKAMVIQTKRPIYNTLKNKSYNQSAYLIVAQKVDLAKHDFEQLKRYIQAGNNVFIASYDFGKLEKMLKFNTASSMSGNGSALNFTNPNLKTDASYGFKRGIGSQYFTALDLKRVTVLGINSSNQPNFIRYNLGKGSLYLLAEPGFYTNFVLLDKYGAEYAGKTLSYLQNSKTIILDEYFSAQKNETTDVLRVFFAHPELKWAYYLTIFSLIIFVLYEIKRKQRIIPTVDPMTNSSVEFVNVVGSVYYHERNNQDIAMKKINYFLEHLRSRYYVKTNEIDPNFSQLLMEKTGINEPSAKTLTRYIMQIPTMASVSDHELIILNDSIEQFYKITQRHGAGTI